jgi:hypothetical protein
VVNKEEEKKEKEEGLGVPPLGSGYPLQFLVRCAALHSLWDFRFYPSRGYAILSLRVPPVAVSLKREG